MVVRRRNELLRDVLAAFQLNRTIYPQAGICSVVNHMVDIGEVERILISQYINRNRPSHMPNVSGGYWWPLTDKGHDKREAFLKNLITKSEDNESEKTIGTMANSS